jgi:glycosyltransferase involved in cell wall biosynthesis
LAVALRDEGIESTVIAPAGEGLRPQDEFEGIPVERFRYAPRRFETLAYDGTMAQQVQSSWKARLAIASLFTAEVVRAGRVSRRLRPSVVHAHWWFPGGVVGTVLRSVRSVPLVTTLHGSDIRVVAGHGLARKVFRHVMRRSSVVTAVSTWLARETTAAVPDVRPVVAPMPIVPALFDPPDDRASDNRTLFVGKLNAQKGIHHLLRALAVMRHPCTLDVVVGVGSSEEPARQLARDLGIAERVRWHPLLPQDQLAKLYRRATVLAMPSVDEGLSLVAIEAQLCETPVVAFASGGLPDVVVEGETGHLVQPGDHAALAMALDAVLGLPDRGAGLGRSGRRHALERFAPRAVAQRYAEIYGRVVDQRAGDSDG